MKLNIWNISDWLDEKHYKFSAKIVDTDSFCYSPRMYIDNADNPELLYLRPQGADTTLILQGRNEIKVYDCPPRMLFNEVCGIFDFYNRWENTLNYAATQNDGLQLMVDASFPVLKNPIFIYNIVGKILAISKDCDPDISEHWADLIKYNYIPDDFMARLKSEIDLSRIFQDKTPTFHDSIQGGSGRFIHCGLFLNNNRIGQFVVTERMNILTMGTKHLINMLLNAISLFLSLHSEQFLPQEKMNTLFCELLTGEHSRANQMELILYNAAWNVSDPLMIVVLEEDSTTNESVFLNRIKHRLESDLDYCITTILDNRIVLMVNCRKHPDFREIYGVISDYAEDFWIGSSNHFSHLDDMDSYYMQALAALHYGKLSRQKYMQISNCSVWTIIDAISQTRWMRTLIHPSVLALLSYDERNKTQLFETFFMYLLNGGNITTAAQKLFIHRNSMRYRLDKIGQLIDFNMDDLVQYEHMILSCWIVIHNRKGQIDGV